MSTWTYIWLAGLGLFFVVEHVNERRRAAAIQRLALQLGFHYLGRAVPASLTLSGTQLAYAKAIWNLIDGERQGMRMVIDVRQSIIEGAIRQYRQNRTENFLLHHTHRVIHVQQNHRSENSVL